MVLILLKVFGVISLITFFAYGIDKLKAKLGAWRIPEKTLICLSLSECCFEKMDALQTGHLPEYVPFLQTFTFILLRQSGHLTVIVCVGMT